MKETTREYLKKEFRGTNYSITLAKKEKIYSYNLYSEDTDQDSIMLAIKEKGEDSIQVSFNTQELFDYLISIEPGLLINRDRKESEAIYQANREIRTAIERDKAEDRDYTSDSRTIYGVPLPGSDLGPGPC